MDTEFKEYMIQELVNMYLNNRIDNIERAKLLRKCMTELDLTVKLFCKKFKIREKTLSEWLSFEKITKKQYEQLRSARLSDSRIIKSLKKKYGDNADAVYCIINSEQDDFNATVEHFTGVLRTYIKQDIETKNGTALHLSNLKTVVDMLNRQMNE